MLSTGVMAIGKKIKVKKKKQKTEDGRSHYGSQHEACKVQGSLESTFEGNALIPPMPGKKGHPAFLHTDGLPLKPAHRLGLG